MIKDQHGMTGARYDKLFNNLAEQLTDDEISNGWYFATDYDGLLVNRNWEGHELTEEEWNH